MKPSNPWTTPLIGTALVVLAIAAMMAGGDGPPNPADHPVGDVVAYYGSHESSVNANAILSGLLGVAFVAFGAQLRTRLALGGAAVLAVAVAVMTSLELALLDVSDKADPGAVQGLAALYHSAWPLFMIGNALFLAGIAVYALRDRELPAWLGYVAAGGAVLAVTPAGEAALPLMLLIVLAASVTLALRARSAQAGAGRLRPAESA